MLGGDSGAAKSWVHQHSTAIAPAEIATTIAAEGQRVFLLLFYSRIVPFTKIDLVLYY